MPTPDRPDPTPAPSAAASPAPARTAAMRFIMITVLIDMVSIGLIVPVLPLLIGNFTTNPTEHVLWYGVVAFAYSAANFFGAPILGGLSDRYGRRPVLMFAFATYSLLAVGCALVSDFTMLLVLRAVQAIASAALSVLPGAIIRDRYSGDGMARMMSTISVVFMICSRYTLATNPSSTMRASEPRFISTPKTIHLRCGSWFTSCWRNMTCVLSQWCATNCVWWTTLYSGAG